MNKLDLNNLSVKTLRQNGYKVRIIRKRAHRIIDNFDTLNTKVRLFSKKELEDYRTKNGRSAISNQSLPFSGITTAEVLTPQGQELTVSTVCSKKDQYNKKLSLSILLGRLRKILNPTENHNLTEHID